MCDDDDERNNNLRCKGTLFENGIAVLKFIILEYYTSCRDYPAYYVVFDCENRKCINMHAEGLLLNSIFELAEPPSEEVREAHEVLRHESESILF